MKNHLQRHQEEKAAPSRWNSPVRKVRSQKLVNFDIWTQMSFKLWSSEGCTIRVVFFCLYTPALNFFGRFILVSHSVQLPKVKTVNRKHWKATVSVMVPLNSYCHVRLPCLFVMLRVRVRTEHENICLIAVWFKRSGPSKVYAKEWEKNPSLTSHSFKVSCSRLTVWWKRSRARQAVEEVQIFDTLVKHFIQVYHRDDALKRFVISFPCHHSQTAVTGAALTVCLVDCSTITTMQSTADLMYCSAAACWEYNLIIISSYFWWCCKWKLKMQSSHIV